MHDIEPYYQWRDRYIASEDERSPFFGNQYDEFVFSNRIYNYLIHPQWDQFGSTTLYTKIIYVDYDKGFAFLEFIGEWNDCLHNDIMTLKKEVLDVLIDQGISKFVIICENVLNFHGSDNCYYEEWWEDIIDNSGWICFVNTLDHVSMELDNTDLSPFVHFGERYNDILWRQQKPEISVSYIESIMAEGTPMRLR